jgi:hypothetical protein
LTGLSFPSSHVFRSRSKRNKKARANSENAEQGRSFGSSTRKKIKKLKDNSKKKKTSSLIYETLQKIYDSIFISYEVIYKNLMDFLPDQSAKDQLSFCKEVNISTDSIRFFPFLLFDSLV